MSGNAGSDPSDDESDAFSDDVAPRAPRAGPGRDVPPEDDSDISESDDDFDPSEMFVYRGKGSIPRNVRRAEVDHSVKFIPDGLFQYCRQLESVLLHEGLLKIGDYGFECCSSLRIFRCPSTVTEIGERAFQGCSNLAAIELPGGLKSIAGWTFNDCASLVGVKIPASVAQVGDGAFSGCANLRSVELCEGLRLIGDYAFTECQSLGSLRIPLSVVKIGEWTFWGCSSLSMVQLHEDLPKIMEGTFGGCPQGSIRFVRLSERMEAMRMDDPTKSIFESRLREITSALTGADRDDDDDSDNEWDAGAVREKCARSLGRAHEFLTYLEIKGSGPVLELALWKTKIEGEGEDGVHGDLVSDEVSGQDLSNAARERKRLKVNEDTERDLRQSRTDCRVKCGAGIVLSEVLKFFPFSTTWPRMDE